MQEWMITLAIAALQVAFYLGIYVAILRQNKRNISELRKELNGVGARVREAEAIEDARYLTVAVAAMAACDPEIRKWLAEQLRHGNRHKKNL